MSDEFKWDVFLSHSSQDKDVVRDIANRLKSDGVRVWFDEWEIQPGDSIPAKIEDGLEQSRVLVLCMSKAAFGSDWAQLESHTFRFKDPLNHNRRFIPLRLDDTPAKGSLAQFSYIDWRQERHAHEYPKLVEAAQQASSKAPKDGFTNWQTALKKAVQLTTQQSMFIKEIYVCVVRHDRQRLLTGGADNSVRVWNTRSGRILRTFNGHQDSVAAADWSPDGRLVVSGAQDRTIRVWNPESPKCVAVIEGHTGTVLCLAFTNSSRGFLSGSSDATVRLWDSRTFGCLEIFNGHTSSVDCIEWSPNGKAFLSGSRDTTIRLWDAKTAQCLRVFRGHQEAVLSISWSANTEQFLSASTDNTIRLWDVRTGQCIRVFEGHIGGISCVQWHTDCRTFVSGSFDKTIRLWDAKTGACNATLRGHQNQVRTTAWNSDNRHLMSTDDYGCIHIWDMSPFIAQSATIESKTSPLDHVQYTNAKVLIVGNSAAGKTGLSNRLALDTYKETDSTVGAWATQWKLPLPEGDVGPVPTGQDADDDADSDGASDRVGTDPTVEREVWLWDFGGQADQRLIHQLYMDQTQVAALVFDPQKDDVFETLGQWDRDLSRADHDKDEEDRMTKLLVAGRCDAGGLRVARSQVEDFARERGYDAFVETSAKTSNGCEELKQAIIDGIKWENIPWRSSPVLFKRLKDEIIKLKDEDRVLMRFNELREVLSMRMTSFNPQPKAQASENDVDEENAVASGSGLNDRFTNAELKAVVGLLAGPGVVWELEFGSWVLLQPERINAYAQAVIQTVREDKHDRGCILEERVLNGDLTYQASIPRLPPDEERFVLLAMHQILVERGLCIRQLIQPVEGTDGHIQSDKPLLIFPSYYRRERPELVGAPAIVVSYEFNGFLDEIYATLVVKLHHTTEFDHDELWRYAADFKSKNGHSLGVRLTRRAEGEGELDVYFGSDVPVGERIIFSKYVHEHLLQSANDVFRLRHYVCPHCGTPVGNRQVAMRKLEEGKKDIPCVECDDSDKRVPLWDELEELFADDAIKQRVRELNEHVRIVLDTESKERALVGEVISTVALAGQICREIQVSDWGLDAEVEFKNDDGQASAKRLWLQLKSGDSFLTTRKKDGAAIFKKFNQRQAEYWMKHAEPVMLLIRNSKGEIQWMDIREELRRVTDNGEKQVRQIVFDGNRFDVMSVRRWRDAALAQV